METVVYQKVFRTSLGDIPKWALTYFPKKEILGKFSSSEISLIDFSECFNIYLIFSVV